MSFVCSQLCQPHSNPLWRSLRCSGCWQGPVSTVCSLVLVWATLRAVGETLSIALPCIWPYAVPSLSFKQALGSLKNILKHDEKNSQWPSSCPPVPTCRARNMWSRTHHRAKFKSPGCQEMHISGSGFTNSEDMNTEKQFTPHVHGVKHTPSCVPWTRRLSTMLLYQGTTKIYFLPKENFFWINAS